MVPRPVAVGFGLAIALLVCGGPLLYESYHTRMHRNVRIVKDGVLYRSAQLPIAGLQRLAAEHRIKTVVCLRDDRTADVRAEEAFCKANGIEFVGIPPRSWLLDESDYAPTEIGLAVFRDVMRDPKKHPVLLHCFAGTHRTGAYVAVYRMDFEGWSNAQALAELRSLGYVNLDKEDDVFGFLSKYRPMRATATPVAWPPR